MTATTPIETEAELQAQLEPFRRELTGYCYRMLGSGFEAEDAVQETMVRAWKNLHRFEGRSSLRSWVYRIATNVCLDMLPAPQRRARPMELGPSSRPDIGEIPAILPEDRWVGPIADDRVIPDHGDPAELSEQRESIRLAFVAALQHLPPKQRAVLILCEVLRWKADEAAELLDTTTASVNSALQRARATLGSAALTPTPLPPDDEHQALLDRYVDAFERYDMTALVALLHEDATMSMPPLPLWLEGRDDVAAWHVGHGIGCEGSRLVPIRVNGSHGFGQYRPAGPGRWEPWSLQTIEVADGKVTGIHHFLVTPMFPGYGELFASFGLPPHLED